MKTTQKILLALSGGVDSAVAAALLRDQGHEVIGATLRLLPGAEGDRTEQGARRVAAELGLPLHVYDCSTAFAEQVIAPFCHAYREGRTPNPCIQCNRLFKFGFLLPKLESLGCDCLATGHYVRLAGHGSSLWLRRAVDARKDQSYFLFTLRSDQLSRLSFPLGDLTKEQVRQHACELGLAVHEQQESQDVCFVPDNDYIRLVDETLTQPSPGRIVHVNGRVLGRHAGIHRYTIGQRRGLGIAWSEPLYVVRLDAALNHVIVGEQSELLRQQLEVDGLVWHESFFAKTGGTADVSCQIRYRHRPVPAQVERLDGGQARVTLASAQSGITPGQAAVFYRDDLVIGGGWIR
ncbi:MAG: tRNA 2-thiouridine(34) synthase MnmA [Desulfuromonadaceae bacterium]|nr:tRNA 2-thiouridine(34) synthase MnmA [Desulfuromonadaceae bacterium]